MMCFVQQSAGHSGPANHLWCRTLGKYEFVSFCQVALLTQKWIWSGFLALWGIMYQERGCNTLPTWKLLPWEVELKSWCAWLIELASNFMLKGLKLKHITWQMCLNMVRDTMWKDNFQESVKVPWILDVWMLLVILLCLIYLIEIS